MTKEKKEWVTPEITELCLENNEGKPNEPYEILTFVGPS